MKSKNNVDDMQNEKNKKNENQSAATVNDNSKQFIGDENEQAGRGLNRRDFIGRGAVGGALALGFLSMPGWLNKNAVSSAQTLPACYGCEIVPYANGAARADAALKIRQKAAQYERDMPIPSHPCNQDEKLYSDRNYIGNFTKTIKRAAGVDGDIFGEVDSTEYCKLLKALSSGSPAKFEEILLGFSNNCGDATFSEQEARLAPNALEPNRQRRLDTPQAGLNFDLEGKDYYQLVNRSIQLGPVMPVAFPPAYEFASAEEGVEIIENYWQALTRDVAFIDYGSSPAILQAVNDLNQSPILSYYYGPLDSTGRISRQVYSRGILPGDTKGPFLSQFFLRDIPYGAQTIPAQIKSPKATKSNNFMTDRPEWRQIQTGQTPDRKTVFDGVRYIRSGRDLAEYVHNDAIYQAYLNAALLLMTPKNMGGLEVPINPYNPYNQRSTVINGYCKQLNFVEFGPSQLLSLLGEVSVRSHKSVWYQKWQVHRRLRPEEYAARVHFTFTNPTSIEHREYPVNEVIKNSSAPDATNAIYNTRFLPQAFPEGSPTHPAYGAGHATLAGACVTILKAWFDSERNFQDFGKILIPTADGLNLVEDTSRSNSTVADELNKLASNVSIGRNIAGVHWRSDYTESIFLGEQVAIQILQDYGYTYNEKFLGFRFRDFSGNLIQVGGNRS